MRRKFPQNLLSPIPARYVYCFDRFVPISYLFFVFQIWLSDERQTNARPTKPSNDMRSIALTVWFFLNVVLLGMCGYIYLLWLQYWRHISVKNSQQPRELAYTQQQPYVEYYDEGDVTTVRSSSRTGNPLTRVSETVLDKSEQIRQVTVVAVLVTTWWRYLGSWLEVTGRALAMAGPAGGLGVANTGVQDI